jgi:hypothetical protein
MTQYDGVTLWVWDCRGRPTEESDRYTPDLRTVDAHANGEDIEVVDYDGVWGVREATVWRVNEWRLCDEDNIPTYVRSVGRRPDGTLCIGYNHPPCGFVWSTLPVDEAIIAVRAVVDHVNPEVL